MQRIYQITQYDNSGKLKPPKLFYLSLMFLARTWILWAMSLAIRPDGEKLLSLFYPHQSNFLIGLVSGTLAILLFFLSGRNNSQGFLSKIWSRGWLLLLLCTLTDLTVQIYSLIQQHFDYSWSASLQLVLVCWILLYLLQSNRLKDSFRGTETKAE